MTTAPDFHAAIADIAAAFFDFLSMSSTTRFAHSERPT